MKKDEAIIDLKQHHVEMIREGQMNIFEAAHQKEKEETTKAKKEAIDKLKKEMEGNKNPYAQVVGQYLISVIEQDHIQAARVLVEGKTIMGSLAEMQKEAQKVKVGNVGVLTDEQGFAIVLKYFGMDVSKTAESVSQTTENVIQKATPVILPSESVAPPKNKKYLEASLDDFL